MPEKRTRHLTCACCGASATGRQWWNRDTGFGVCPTCYTDIVARCGETYAIECYGRPGVHHSLDLPQQAPRFRFDCPECGHIEIFSQAGPSVTCPACAGTFPITNTLALEALAAVLFPNPTTPTQEPAP